MKITKFAHACVLLEDSGKAVLVDPGNYAWDAGQINISDLPKLDEIVVTHEHADHFHQPFVEALIAANPEAIWVTNPSVAAKLSGMGATHVTTESTPLVAVTTVKHEKLPVGEAPANIQADVFGKFTHPGDSHSSTRTCDTLGLAFTAPWGSMTDAVETVMRLKPKVVIPVHDAMWKTAVQNTFFEFFKEYFDGQGIKMIIPVEGEPFEV